MRIADKNGRSPNKRFGASGAVTRPKVCADLEVSRPSKPPTVIGNRQTADGERKLNKRPPKK
jgi:hypothetical protein